MKKPRDWKSLLNGNVYAEVTFQPTCFCNSRLAVDGWHNCGSRGASPLPPKWSVFYHGHGDGGLLSRRATKSKKELAVDDNPGHALRVGDIIGCPVPVGKDLLEASV